MPAGRPRQFNEITVIEKAMEAFWRHGYRGIGIQALLDHMGISRQSLYNTFGDKRQLFITTIDHYMDRYLGPQVALLDRPGSAADNVIDFAQEVCDLARKDFPRGCLITNTLVELGPHDPEIAEKVSGLMSQLEDKLTACLTRGQQAGEITTDRTANSLAHSACSTIVGMAVASKMTPPDEFYQSSMATLRSALLK